MSFPCLNPDDKEPWNNLFHIILAYGRPASASCVGWGHGKATKPDAKKRSTGKEKKKKLSGTKRKKEIQGNKGKKD